MPNLTVVLVVLGGCAVWLLVAIGVGAAFGRLMRMRDRQVPRPDTDQPPAQEGPP